MAKFAITIVSITGLFFISCNESDLLDRYISHRIQSGCFANVCNQNTLDSIYSDSNEFFLNSMCCSGCSCNSTCLIPGDCCPDFKPTSDADENIPRGGLYRCVQGNLKSKGMSNYLMISKCLENFTDTDIKGKCSSYTPSLGLQYYIPMYNNVTRVSYRNRYCAECNFESVYKLVNWEVELLCLTNPLAKIVYSTLVGDVMARDGCNLYLQPPEMSQAETCDDVIDTCNQTGLWTNFDPITADGCESYRSGYKHFYRNVFCYRCNEVSAHLGNEMCTEINKNFGGTTPALSVLFDFKADATILTEQTMEHRCPSKTVYNPFLDVCNTVMCEHDFIYTEGKCRPYSSPECMNAFLLFRSENELLKIQIDEIFEIFGTSLDENLNLSQMTSWDIHKLITNNLTLFILHISFIYDVDFVRNLTNFSKLPFVLRYNRTDLKQEYQISFDITIENQIDNYTRFYNLSDESKSEQHSFDIRGPGLATASSLSPTPQCNHARAILTLTRFTVCPWIELSLNDFNINITESITFVDLGLVLTNKTFQYKTNPTGEIIQGTKEIKVCLHDFFVNKTKANVLKRVSKPVLGWLTSITSLVSIASCLLTVVTYLLFPTLRTQPGINNMILSLYILFGHIVYIVGILHDASALTCSIIGITLHLLWLSTILWYGVCSFHMFRVFNSTAPMVSNPLTETTVRYTLFVTTVAIFFILVNLVTSVVVSNGVDLGYGDPNTGICWISRPSYAAYTITCPALLTVTCSMTLFIVAVIRIRQSTNVNLRSNRNRQTFLIYLKLSALTGITWLTIIPYIFTRNEIFNYLFIGLHGCNGLFLMMSFILNKRVFLLYKSFFARTRKCHDSSSQPTSVSSINSMLASISPSDSSFNYVNSKRETSDSSLNSVFTS